MTTKYLLPIPALAALLCSIILISTDALAQLPYPPATFQAATPSTISNDPVLTITAPQEGEVIEVIQDCDTCPAYVEFDATLSNFTLGEQTTGYYPCATPQQCDTCIWKGDGQHIYVVVDKGLGRAITDLNPGAFIRIDNPTPGPHVLIAYLCRSWDENLKDLASISANRETDLYAVRTFYIDTNTGTHAIDSTVPLLTPNSPLDTANYTYPADSVLLDFYVMFKDLSGGYVVEATVYDSTMQVRGRDTLEEWVPYCIGGLEEPPVGRLRKYFMQTRLLDTTAAPVPNGPGNLNNRQWPFWVRRQ